MAPHRANEIFASRFSADEDFDDQATSVLDPALVAALRWTSRVDDDADLDATHDADPTHDDVDPPTIVRESSIRWTASRAANDDADALVASPPSSHPLFAPAPGSSAARLATIDVLMSEALADVRPPPLASVLAPAPLADVVLAPTSASERAPEIESPFVLLPSPLAAEQVPARAPKLRLWLVATLVACTGLAVLALEALPTIR